MKRSGLPPAAQVASSGVRPPDSLKRLEDRQPALAGACYRRSNRAMAVPSAMSAHPMPMPTKSGARSASRGLLPTVGIWTNSQPMPTASAKPAASQRRRTPTASAANSTIRTHRRDVRQLGKGIGQGRPADVPVEDRRPGTLCGARRGPEAGDADDQKRNPANNRKEALKESPMCIGLFRHPAPPFRLLIGQCVTWRGPKLCPWPECPQRATRPPAGGRNHIWSSARALSGEVADSSGSKARQGPGSRTGNARRP